MQYANISDLIPQRLPCSYTHEGKLYMGLDAMTDAQLATLGWYPVRREPLAEGATGWGEMYADDQTNEFVIPSLPANPEAAHERYLDGLQCTRTQALIAIEDATNGLVFETPIDLKTPFIAWRDAPERTLTDQAFLDHPTWKYRDPRIQAVGIGLFGLTDEQLIALIEYAKTR
jgi:hypothetical protein